MGIENSKTLQEAHDLLSFPESYPFPYEPENFDNEEKEVLSKFFTNVDKPVFAIHGLPQEVIGAMFSRYSRTSKSVRRVFLDEFWGASELGIQNITAHLVQEGEEFEKARDRANKFYKRVFVEYGDDSVIQMGSVHIAFEGVSQIATKAIEDGRIAAAYIEKSTRYVDFGSKINDHYLYTEVPEIMESEYAEEFVKWNEDLFDAYVKNLPITVNFLRSKYPLGEQPFINPQSGEEVVFTDIGEEKDRKKAKKAYERALKSKAFDTVRVFLPTTTVTNLGAHFSGQSAENAVNKLLSSDYAEVKTLGLMALNELTKVAPNFIQNVDHKYGRKTRQYFRFTKELRDFTADLWVGAIPKQRKRNRVKLVDWDQDADVKLASQLIYTGQGRKGRSKEEILKWAREIKEHEKKWKRGKNRWFSPTLAEVINSAMINRAGKGLNRRHKLPRAFEHAFVEAEFYVDFGIFRDLQRNRMSSTERVMLTAEDVFIPPEFKEEGMEEVLKDYLRLARKTKELNTKVNENGDTNLNHASEYITIFGNKLRFNIRANLRQWVFFSELRTIAGGHPTYRKAMQVAAKQIIHVMPFMKDLFAHVNWRKDYGLGRMSAEVKTQEKLEGLEDE